MALSSLFTGPAERPWRFFQNICSIPRPSGCEERLRRYLRDWSDGHGWPHRVDVAGNLVICVPGLGAAAGAPTLVLQGHLDMVCEKNVDSEHNFMRDGIVASVAGDWVVADGTTLGADNGVAVALGCALVTEKLANRCPIELLFTVDEEVGLTGAQKLDPSIVSGRQILNLDSEEDGVFTISCAGGVDLQVKVPVELQTGHHDGWHAGVRGLRGGHSGVNIHEERANAIHVLADWLAALQVGVHSFHGGNKKNAIPREAYALVSGCSESDLERTRQTVQASLANEPNVELYWHQVSVPHCRVGANIAKLIHALPQGVLDWDPHCQGMVRTSASLGVAAFSGEAIVLTMHGRSSSEAERERMVERVRTIAGAFGCGFHSDGDYPGWDPNPDSALLTHAIAAYRECFGKSPVVKGIHAGLGTGIIGKRVGTGELLSVGPQIENAHSPDERLHIASFERTYAFLKQLVSRDWA